MYKRNVVRLKSGIVKFSEWDIFYLLVVSFRIGCLLDSSATSVEANKNLITTELIISTKYSLPQKLIKILCTDSALLSRFYDHHFGNIATIFPSYKISIYETKRSFNNRKKTLRTCGVSSITLRKYISLFPIALSLSFSI